jgi:hypothetical protein
VSFGLEGGSESLESPLHEMVEGVWEVVFCIFLVYSMLPLRSNWRLFARHVCGITGAWHGGAKKLLPNSENIAEKFIRFKYVQPEEKSLILATIG